MKSVIARQSVKATIISYIGATLGFITTFFILTKFLSPEEIGLTRILLEVATLFSSIGLIGLTSSIYRFFPYFKDKDEYYDHNNLLIHKGFFYYITTISFLGISFASIFYIVFKPFIIEIFTKNSPLYINFYYSVIPLTFFLGFWTIYELYAAQLMRVVVPRFIREVLMRCSLLIVYLLYAFKVVNLEMMVYLYICVYGISMLFCLWYLSHLIPINMKHKKNIISEEVKKVFFRYTILYTIGAIGTIMSSRMDLFMVSSIDKGGLTSVGIYTIAFYMVAVLDIPSRVIMSMSTPAVAISMSNNDMSRTQQLFKKVALYELLSGMFIFVAVWTSIDSIFKIMPNGEEYVSGKWVFFFLGLAKMVELIFNFGTVIVSCSKYYYWNIYYTISVIIIAFLSNYYLIPQYQIKGAAISTLITMFIGFGGQQLLIYRNINVHPFSRKMLKLIIIGIVSIIISYFLPSKDNIISNIILRSGSVSILFIICVYLFNIAPETIDFIRPIIKKLGYTK